MFRVCTVWKKSSSSSHLKRTLFTHTHTHTRSKHSQTVIFSLFAPEIENSQPYHQRPSLSKPNSCIFITFSICTESSGCGEKCGSAPSISSPPLTLSWALFVFPPLINKQVACALFQRLWAKVTFSLLCDICFWGWGLLSWRKVASHSDHRRPFVTVAT